MRHCAAMTSPAAQSSEASLVRALGVRQLAASIVNVTVGAGITSLPSVRSTSTLASGASSSDDSMRFAPVSSSSRAVVLCAFCGSG